MKSVFPLLLLGAGAWFLAKPKKEPASNEKGIITGSKERGYIITNCNLVIYDEQKAFDYAYAKGIEEAKKNEWNTAAIKFNLFGDCLSPSKITTVVNTRDNALFIFNLLKLYSSGVVSVNIAFSDDVLKNLSELKNLFGKLLNIDTSDFKVELVKKT